VFVEGEWIWTTTRATISPTHWAPSEPNDAAPHEDCLLLKHDGNWNDEPCSIMYPFICETE